MGRYYMHCPRCRKRMRRFHEDSEERRVFYVCPDCANRGTLLVDLNGWSDDWPLEVFNEAVREGVLTEEGGVVA